MSWLKAKTNNIRDDLEKYLYAFSYGLLVISKAMIIPY